MRGKIVALIGITMIGALVATILMSSCKPTDKTTSFDFGHYDRFLVEDLVYSYDLTYHAAMFLALTKFETTPLNNDGYEIRANFPTGNKALLTVNVSKGNSYSPSPDEPVYGSNDSHRIFGMKYSYDQTAKQFNYKLEYFIPSEDLPQETVAQIGMMTAPRQEQRLLYKLFGFGQAYAQESGISVVQVVTEGIVDLVQDYAVGQFEEFVGKEIVKNGWIESSGVTSTIDTATGILEAWSARGDHLAWQNRLDRARSCAENPTNSLTQKMYNQDPFSKQKIVDEIERTQTELKTNSAVRFLNIMASVATGLVELLPGLDFVAGNMTQWTDEGLKGVNEQYLQDVEDMVTPCDADGPNMLLGNWKGQIEYNWTWTYDDGYGKGKEVSTMIVDRLQLVWIEEPPNPNYWRGRLIGTFAANYDSSYTSPDSSFTESGAGTGVMEIDVILQLHDGTYIAYVRTDSIIPFKGNSSNEGTYTGETIPMIWGLAGTTNGNVFAGTETIEEEDEYTKTTKIVIWAFESP